MSTSKPRIQAYIETALYDQFEQERLTWELSRSQALEKILLERYQGSITREPVSNQDNLTPLINSISELRSRVSRLEDELESKLLSQLEDKFPKTEIISEAAPKSPAGNGSYKERWRKKVEAKYAWSDGHCRLRLQNGNIFVGLICSVARDKTCKIFDSLTDTQLNVDIDRLILPSELDSNLPSELESELDSNLPSELESELDSNLPSELESELDSNLPSELESELESELDSNLPSELESELDSNLPSELESELESELDSNLPSELESELDSNLPSELDNGITQLSLAKRLKCTDRYVRKMAKEGKLEQWSKEKDPDQIAWEFRDKKYYPLIEDQEGELPSMLELSNGLSADSLARRFGVTYTYILKLEKQGELEGFSKDADPQKLEWELREGQYYPKILTAH